MLTVLLLQFVSAIRRKGRVPNLGERRLVIVPKNVTVFKGMVRSIEIRSRVDAPPNTLVLSINLEEYDSANDIRLTFSGLGSITVHWLLHSDYSITISELHGTDWQKKTYHVLVNSSDDFDFYASSVQVMRDL